MAYTGTLCTEAEIALKVGENVDATGNTEANHNDAVAQIQSYLCVLSRYNWIDNYASLNADVKRLLSEVTSNLAAIYFISYNMSGYTTRIEAEDMINILYARALMGLQLLTDQNSVTYMINA